MEEVLKDLYERKQSRAVFAVEQEAEEALNILNLRLDQKLEFFQNWANNPDAKVDNPALKADRPTVRFENLRNGNTSTTKIEEQIQGFGSKVSEVPGFEELEGKSSAPEIVCWSLVLFVLIALTIYSFVHLIMDYLENPLVTQVEMQYSPYTDLPDAVLCFPLYLDQKPFQDYHDWKETSEILRKLSTMNSTLLQPLFSCQKSKTNRRSLEKKFLKIRLINEFGKKNDDYGRVEVFLNGRWGAVCNELWDNLEAGVVCRMVKGKKRVKEAKTLHAITGGKYPSVTWMDAVRCGGWERNLGYCEHQGWARAKCEPHEYAAVDCTGNANPAPANHSGNQFYESKLNETKFSVRLINEKGHVNTLYGTVELKYNGFWGTISDEGWGEAEAQVVCRALGYPEKNDAVQGLQGSLFGSPDAPTWLQSVVCNGSESNIGQCSLKFTYGGIRTPLAGVDCSGDAAEAIKIKGLIKNYKIGRTAAAVLARMTALETWRLVKGETKASFKWSTSPRYPAGNYFKEQAIENLFKLMETAGYNRSDFNALQEIVKCGLCGAADLRLYLQRDKYTREAKEIFDCGESWISWIEDSDEAQKACVGLPLGKKTKIVKKGSILLSVDIGNMYNNSDWTDSRVKESFTKEFKLDLTGSISAATDTMETIQLFLGEEQTVTVDASKRHIAEHEDCSEDASNCDLKCIGETFYGTCSHCTPITWVALLELDHQKPFCTLKDYKSCFQMEEELGFDPSECSEQCIQPCEQTTYSVRTVSRKTLASGSSASHLYIKVDSEVFPEFSEESVITWYQLMGDLGGVIGLWLGASFVGVLHFFEYLVKDILLAKKIERTISRDPSLKEVASVRKIHAATIRRKQLQGTRRPVKFT